LLSPWADMRLISQSMQERVNRDAIVKPKILKEWGAYYAGKEPLDNPNLSSVLADLSGLPPLLIQVGTEETLYDDSITIYNNAIRDGVKAELYIANKMPHVWHMYYDISGEAASDLRKVADYLGG
jgi:epsilon-lactone hydrolase